MKLYRSWLKSIDIDFQRIRAEMFQPAGGFTGNSGKNLAKVGNENIPTLLQDNPQR
jgi:hypothetical protein